MKRREQIGQVRVEHPAGHSRTGAAPALRTRSAGYEQLLALQASAGNAAVARAMFVARAAGRPGAEAAVAVQRVASEDVDDGDDESVYYDARDVPEESQSVDAMTPAAEPAPAPVEERAEPVGTPLEEVAGEGAARRRVPFVVDESVVGRPSLTSVGSAPARPESSLAPAGTGAGHYLSKDFWDGDPAKAVGNVAASASPLLQSVGALVAGAGGATYAGTALAGFSAAGDLASEVTKYRDTKKLNIGKAGGGALGFAGAALTAAGQGTGIPALRGVGYGTQAIGLLLKSIGEGKKLEDLPMPWLYRLLGRREPPVLPR